jgi:hypothetical protein
MFKSPSLDVSSSQPIAVSRCDRWRICHRLQELAIPSSCPDDGSLQVEVNSVSDAVLIRSTVMQFTASRQELIDWLKRCWEKE